MSEERRSPHNNESDESGLLLSVEPTERSLDFTGLSDDTDNVDTDATDAEDTMGDTDAEDTAGDTDGTDDTGTITADDADARD
jgi:hypothetical protein